MPRISFGQVVLVLVAVAFHPQPANASEDVGPLLSTHWGQRDEYAKYAPLKYRVGCWSTAFGQILNYHELFPRPGDVQYRCTNKKSVIKENTGAHKFKKRRLSRSKDEVARYLYTVAIIIQKDFGTGSYLLKHHERASMIERYFDCTTKLHKALDKNQLVRLLRTEIDQGRPVFIHLRDKEKKKFHAAVVDGYKKGNDFLFHINMGHKGRDDNWFHLDQAIDKYDDTTYHRIVTILPNE